MRAQLPIGPALVLGSAPMPLMNSPKKEAVLAIGLDKPTGEIIAAAKAKGVTVSRTYVDLLKKGAGAKPAAPKAAKAPAAPKAAAPKPAAPKPAAPKAVAPKAVAPAAPKRGPGRPPGSGKKPAAPAVAKSDDAEKAFRGAAARLILSHGLGHAQAVLESVVGSVKAALGA